MKRLFFIFVLLLSACSQATPTADAPQVATEIFPATHEPTTDSATAAPLTVVALGDSLTQGDGDDTGRGYPARVLDMLNAVRPNSTMTNLGQSGWSSDALINGDQGIESQLTRAMAELKSATSQGRGAVAFVWIGSNDLWYLYEYGGDINDEGDAQDAARFSANMDTILGQLRGAGAQVVIALLDDQSKRPVALKGEAFVSITPDELNRMSAQTTRYNQIIAEKANQYGAVTADFYSTDIFTNPATLYDDGNHPNQAGYDIIAQKWFEALSPLLR